MADCVKLPNEIPAYPRVGGQLTYSPVEVVSERCSDELLLKHGTLKVIKASDGEARRLVGVPVINACVLRGGIGRLRVAHSLSL